MSSNSIFTLPDKDLLCSQIKKYLKDDIVRTIFILSDEVYNLANGDKDFRDKLREADLLLASNSLMARDIIRSNDGNTIEVLGQQEDFSRYEYNSFDVIMNVIEVNKSTVFILTQDEMELEKCNIMLKKDIPEVKSWEKCCHDIMSVSESVINEINGIAPDVLMCSFDSPFEEKWILDNKDKMNTKMILGIGPGVKKAKKHKASLKGYIQNLIKKKE